MQGCRVILLKRYQPTNVVPKSNDMDAPTGFFFKYGASRVKTKRLTSRDATIRDCCQCNKNALFTDTNKNKAE